MKKKKINVLIKSKTQIYKGSNFKSWSEQKSTRTRTLTVVIVLKWHCLATDVTPKTLMAQYMPRFHSVGHHWGCGVGRNTFLFRTSQCRPPSTTEVCPGQQYNFGAQDEGAELVPAKLTTTYIYLVLIPPQEDPVRRAGRMPSPSFPGDPSTH